MFWRYFIVVEVVVVEERSGVVLASFGQTSGIYALVGPSEAQKCTMGGAQPLGVREPCSG